jgi:hypothetical protein
MRNRSFCRIISLLLLIYICTSAGYGTKNEHPDSKALSSGGPIKFKKSSTAQFNPLLFLISEHRTGAILFLGRVVNPL